MTKIADKFYKWPCTIISIFVIPFFLFDFILIYTPLRIMDYLETGPVTPLFNATIILCINLVVMAIFRLIFHFLGNVMRINYVLYALWCVGEVAVFSAFAALFLCLISGGVYPFFNCLVKSFFYGLMILFIPYVIIALSFVIYWLRTSKNNEAADPTLIRFRDGYQRLKLALSAQSLYYIEASENYVHICYEDRSGLKVYTLRSSMKNIESLVHPAGIVRCHRTYFVNPTHVRMIGKTPEGCLFAELDNQDAPHIPISRTYYDKLSVLL